MQKTTSHSAGLAAERRAAWFLRLKGYGILASRYRTPVGEIDLVARRGRVLVFVEVKARPTADAGVAAILPAAQERIRRAAALYLQKHPEYNGHDIRFDALAMSGWSWPRHEKNAF